MRETKNITSFYLLNGCMLEGILKTKRKKMSDQNGTINSEEQFQEEVGLDAPLEIETAEEPLSDDEGLPLPKTRMEWIGRLQDHKRDFANAKTERDYEKLKKMLENEYPHIPSERRLEAVYKKGYKQFFGEVISELRRIKEYRTFRSKIH